MNTPTPPTSPTTDTLLREWPSEAVFISRDPASGVVAVGGQPKALRLDPDRGYRFDADSRAYDDPLSAISALIERREPIDGFGGWICMLSYELGHAIEPAAGTLTAPTRWPLAVFVRVDHGFVREGDGLWRRFGEPRCRADTPPARAPTGRDDDEALPPFGTPTPTNPAEWYTERVERAIEHIRAGDIYQANLTHWLESSIPFADGQLFPEMIAHAQPRFAARIPRTMLDHRVAPSTDGAVISVSPELFLHYDPREGRIITEPMKGTRPAGADPDELRGSPKDKAELAMIVDLMRNDLGRFAKPASVRVDRPRVIERHGPDDGGVWQAIATVSAEPTSTRPFIDALRAAFPAGSITGAPKIRAMQLIRELEGVERGPYCGAMGFLRDDGGFTLSVSIRTALIETSLNPLGAGLRYGVGAGIVADSDPLSEWRETLDKAAWLRSLAREPEPTA